MAYIGKNPKVKSIVSEGDTLANLIAEPRKAGRMVYATDTQKYYWDDGVSLIVVGTEAGGGSDNVIADNLVDMDASTNYYNAVGSIANLNVKNGTNGDVTQLVVVNTTGGNITVNWNSAVSISVLSNNTVVSAGAAAVYTIAFSNGEAYVSLIEGDASPPFPTGIQGDLTILSGQNVNLANGSFYDYANIDIQAGGTLTITDASNTWNPVELYAAQSFNLDGQIIFRQTERTTTTKTGNFATGYAYSVTTTQRNGGTGGAGGTSGGTGGAGGAGTNGYGGGGGGGSAYGLNSAAATGGAGGSNNGGGGNGAVGSGPATAGSGASGNITNSTGSNGASASTSINGGAGGTGGGSGGGGGASTNQDAGVLGTHRGSGGGGGGGGHKGLHGGILYLFCNAGITGSGTVNLSGTSGFAGGVGGNGNRANSGRGSGGGGGGGGAGGNGGTLFRTAPSFTPSVDVSGGAGGAGRTGGAAAGGAIGGTGGSGLTGNAGSIVDI